MTIRIDIATVRTGLLPKGQKPVTIETRTLKPSQRTYFKDFTGRRAATLVGTEKDGCFGQVIQRHLTPDTDTQPKIIDITDGHMAQFQIFSNQPNCYRVITVTSQTTLPSHQTPGT